MAEPGQESSGRGGKGRGAGGGNGRGGGKGRGAAGKGRGGSGRGQGGGGRRGRPEVDPMEKLRRKLQTVLIRLPETQRRVLELRMGLVDGVPHNLSDTARELGLSMSETRDIEKRAFEHIREVMPLEQLQQFLRS